MQTIITTDKLLTLLVAAAALLAVSQPCNAQQREDSPCIGSDTLDLLPAWNYCQIIAGLQGYFPDSFFDSRNMRTFLAFDPDSDMPDSMDFRAVSLLAWGMYKTDRTRSRFRRVLEEHNKPIITYTDRILLRVEFVRGRSAQPGVAIVAMERDTSVSEAWRISRTSLIINGQTIPYPWATCNFQFFDLKNDTTLIRKTADEYREYVIRPETPRDLDGIEVVLQHSYVRHRTWDAVLGREPLPQQPGME